jgi:hypothetical protein
MLSMLIGAVASGFGARSPARLGALCFIAAPAILGLHVTATWEEVTESRAWQLILAMMTPPESYQEDK